MNQRFTKTHAKEEITKLVQKFKDDFHDIKNPQMKEAQLEDTYIKPLFSFLNWNIHTSGIKKGMEEFRVQTSQRVKKSTKQPDYELWLPEKENPSQMKRHLFMEAKDPKYDLQKEVQWMRQAYQYAHSTLSLSERSNKRTNLSILTDFEEFRLFDCRDPYPLTKNDASLYNKYVIKKFDLRYTDYIENFDLLWDTFERNNVQNGSLASFEITDKDLKKNRIAPDLKFLDDLKQWRLDFARSMYKSNKSVSNEHLTSATQTLINRIIFLKMLTDREIEDDYLTKILERIENDKEEISIYDSCRDIFQELDKKYNGDIFKRRDDLDPVKVENKVFKKILKSLRPEKSVYTLNAMPVEIIGNAYEQFLGDVIVHKGRGIAAEPKPEVRKAGGVYYTPKYIVDYIVENTVGEKLKKCKNPKDVSEIKIVDPACGSGSFLLGAYDILVEWHLNYFKSQVDKLFKNGKTLNQINKKYLNEVKCHYDDNEVNDFQNSLHLTSKLKKQILNNNLFGVDIDSNAVEITKFSLNMKALENTTHDELYEDYDLFHQTLLPELGNNIKCGNSLVGSDYFDGKILFDMDERKKVNAFDWEVEFSEIFKEGGFDCVIGNPPYVKARDYNKDKDFCRNYLNKSSKYQTLYLMWDLYIPFVEKGLNILNTNGFFGYIIPDTLEKSEYSKLIKKFILKNYFVTQIDFFPESYIFHSEKKIVGIKNIVLFVKKSRGKKTRKIIHAINYTEIQKENIVQYDENIFSTYNLEIDLNNVETLTLSDICLVSYGLRLNSDKDDKNPKFKKVDLLSDKKNEINWKPFTEGKYLSRYNINKYKFLELDSDRCPKRLVRPTFKELYESNKLLLGRQKRVCVFDEKNTIVDNTIMVCSLHKSFEGLENSNLNKYYNNLNANREYLVQQSKNHSLKYLLGILNSTITKYYLMIITKGGIDAYPDDWKNVIIPFLDIDNKKDKAHHDQMVVFVNTMLSLNKELQKVKTEHEKELIQRQINATDNKIDKLVYKLYDLTPEEIDIIEESVK